MRQEESRQQWTAHDRSGSAISWRTLATESTRSHSASRHGDNALAAIGAERAELSIEPASDFFLLELVSGLRVPPWRVCHLI